MTRLIVLPLRIFRSCETGGSIRFARFRGSRMRSGAAETRHRDSIVAFLAAKGDQVLGVSQPV